MSFQEPRQTCPCGRRKRLSLASNALAQATNQVPAYVMVSPWWNAQPCWLCSEKTPYMYFGCCRSFTVCHMRNRPLHGHSMRQAVCRYKDAMKPTSSFHGTSTWLSLLRSCRSPLPVVMTAGTVRHWHCVLHYLIVILGMRMEVWANNGAIAAAGGARVELVTL